MTPSPIRVWKNRPIEDSVENGVLVTMYELASEPAPIALTGRTDEEYVYQVMQVYPAEWGKEDRVKSYWAGPQMGHVTRQVLVEAPEEQTGIPGEAVTSSSRWPALWERQETERGIRGVFSPPYRRKVLFSGEISIAPSRLKRLRPRIAIDLRRLER